MHELELIQSALPRYEIQGELGRGAWGVVLAGTHKALGRPVAVKQLPRAFGADPEVRSRFLSEARMLASLDHPHIVQMFDFVERDGLCLIVMELLTGGTVWDRFSGEGLSPQAACAVVAGTCEGLHYAHEKGVLHRDIKPQNLMFSGEGVLKITDFGIAKVVAGSRTLATQAGFVLGTPAYMSPEQAQGKELTACADIYAAGTVLYELLSGTLPYPDLSDPVAGLYQRVHEEPVWLSKVAPELPEPLVDVVHRAMARDTADRFQTGHEFALALTSAATDAWGAEWSQVSGVILRGSGMAASSSGLTSTPAPGTVPPPASVDEALVTGGRPKRATTRLQPAAVAAVDVKPEDLVPAGDVLAPLPESTRPGGGGRRGVLVGAAVAIVVAIAVVAALVLGGGDDDPPAEGAGSPTTEAPAAGDGGQQATPATAPLFVDDFSRPDNAWLTGDDAEVRLAFEGGGYAFTVKRANQVQIVDTAGFAGRPNGTALTTSRDVAVQANVTFVRGSGRMGVGCRGNPNEGNFYLASITETGAWSIDRLFNGQITQLRVGNGPTTAAGGQRELRLDCYDADGQATLDFSLDGQRLGRVADTSPLPGGALAMLGATAAGPELELRFTRFAVYPPVAGENV